jgi:hypothetical protein
MKTIGEHIKINVSGPHQGYIELNGERLNTVKSVQVELGAGLIPQVTMTFSTTNLEIEGNALLKAQFEEQQAKIAQLEALMLGNKK